MDLTQLKAEARALSDQDRRDLIDYLLQLSQQRTPEYWDRLAAKVEDQDPLQLVAEEALDQALGIDRPKVRLPGNRSGNPALRLRPTPPPCWISPKRRPIG